MGVGHLLLVLGWAIRFRREVCRDWRGDLQVAEIRGVAIITIAARADADELDLGHDEAVAAGVVAHAALEVCEAVQVLDALVRLFVAHAAVPAVEALDEADEAAALAAGGCAF